MTEPSDRQEPQVAKRMLIDVTQAVTSLVSVVRKMKAVEEGWPDEMHGCRDRSEHRRSICVHLLGAFNEFLREIGHGRDVPDALMLLTMALNDAEDGKESEFLTIRRGSKRPALSSIVMTLRGRVAGVQDYLMANGMTQKDAAKFVFRKLGNDAVERIRGQKDKSELSWRTVNRWRNEPKDDDNRDFWANAMEVTKFTLSKVGPGPSPTRVAEALLSDTKQQACSALPEFE